MPSFSEGAWLLVSGEKWAVAKSRPAAHLADKSDHERQVCLLGKCELPQYSVANAHRPSISRDCAGVKGLLG